MVIELLREAAKGLDYLNSRSHSLDGRIRGGIYHCDVKPQNILLMGGSVKVADFGLSKFTMHSLTDRDAGLTIMYAAPEFLKGKAARQSDQYSLAVVYCQVRGGRLPFVGSTAEVMAGHLVNHPDLSMLPLEERPAVLRALSKDPRARFESCMAFVDSLAKVESKPAPGRSWWIILLLKFLSLGHKGRDTSEKTTEPWASSGIPGEHVPVPTTIPETSSTTDHKPGKVVDLDGEDLT